MRAYRRFVDPVEVARAAGIKMMTLSDWIQRGIVSPAINVPGWRSPRHPRRAMIQAMLAQELRDEGWTIDAIAQHMKYAPGLSVEQDLTADPYRRAP